MRSLPMLILLTAMYAVCSCKSDKDRIAEIVEYWQGRKITFPETMTDFLTGDTIDLADADFTIFNYVDSVGCTGCKMKMPIWLEFLNSLDSSTNSDVRFVMVVEGADKKILNYLARRNGFDYPIYVDTDHHMAQAYSFPEELAFQTFLLDKHKKVLVIGNPVYTSEIERIYKAILSGKMAFSTDASMFVTIEPNRINLGNLHSHEEVNHSVIISNPSEDTIRIRKIVSSCECTNLEIPDGELPSESNVEATLTFNVDTISGEFDRVIHVYYEDFDYPSVINVCGYIFK